MSDELRTPEPPTGQGDSSTEKQKEPESSTFTQGGFQPSGGFNSTGFQPGAQNQGFHPVSPGGGFSQGGFRTQLDSDTFAHAYALGFSQGFSQGFLKGGSSELQNTSARHGFLP
jgi:hypothetical protein